MRPHFLYLYISPVAGFTAPQGQGSLRPTFSPAGAPLCGAEADDRGAEFEVELAGLE